ncbi:MAG: BamA/TamA family outer membrane protein, partial [bacterium]
SKPFLLRRFMHKFGTIFFLIVVVLATNCWPQDRVQSSQTARPEKKTKQTESSPAGKSQTEPQQIDDYPDPNLIPYRTKKSALVHLLSVPAKIWHAVWLPLGATVIFVEQNRIPQKAANFFMNDDFTAGFFPLLSFGGNTGVGAGFTVFHNNLFDKRKKIRATFLYSSTESNSMTLSYADSSLFGSAFYFDLTGSYFNDSDENLYISPATTLEQFNDSSIAGNRSTEADETSYETEEVGALAHFGYAISRDVRLGVVSSFRHANIGNGDGTGGDKFPDAIAGRGQTSLFAIGGTLTFNFSKGWPRTHAGNLLRVAYTYNRELGGRRFEFNRFRAEVQQFIAVPFFARNRRLAVRGVFEKIDRLGEKQIPFYELSLLGDAANLRGFDQNRFRGRGKVFFNFEYRYPIWDTWDGVIFLDEGQVYDDLDDLALDEFHGAVGAGIRFMSPSGFLARFEVARSNEQWRALFQIVPNF